MNIWLLALIICVIASVMTMTGRGGGNFYVLAIALSGISMHEAATDGQFVLMISSLSATLFFNKRKTTDWKLVVLIGSITLVSAFAGGLLSDRVPDRLLKLVFAFFVFVASLLMFKPVKKQMSQRTPFSFSLRSGEAEYTINALVVFPVVVTTGFVAGMVGVSGGSFLVPLMVLVMHVPMHIAVGSSTTLVMITASAGFLGHLSSGHFDIAGVWPLALGGALGGGLGAKWALAVKPRGLKYIFAMTSLVAAVIMVVNVLMSR